MLIKFLRSIRYAKDGIHLETALEGQTLDLPLILAKALIRDKYAEEVKAAIKKEEIKKEEAKTDAISTESGQPKLAESKTSQVNTKDKLK